ncbi:MAG: metallophosphoesterase [Bacteroidota bacterium]|nr:metallophosphoesterase [Bacteroidota bacterium]MDX5429033.1 metallophosphoesterase [Bacteroidota bacterium]MDX5448325.1 metallophosphoesterase [Bacteroidota bacterium]MDX5506697.1 metallophosphoesterase [Bacteroidota bacterium]
MKIFIVGDVHGCYHTFKQLLDEYWDPTRMFLVQVGDLLNKGKHNADCFRFAKDLVKTYPYQAFFLKGNHEIKLLEPGKDRTALRVRREMKAEGIEPVKLKKWVDKLPLKWETPNVLITHAGVAKGAIHPFSEESPRGVIHNRSALANIGKLQVIGHNMQERGRPRFFRDSNAWCIDTGAVNGKRLTGMILDHFGRVEKIISIPTLKIDL